MSRPLFNIEYIRKFAIRIGATTNADVVMFIDQLEAQLNEDNQNNGFGVDMPPLPNLETPAIIVAVAEIVRTENIAQDATDHAGGLEPPPPENTETATSTGTSTATGATAVPDDCGPMAGTLHTPHAQTKGHK